MHHTNTAGFTYLMYSQSLVLPNPDATTLLPAKLFEAQLPVGRAIACMLSEIQDKKWIFLLTRFLQ